MQELIKINMDTQTVSARDLHEKLNIGTQFTKWFARMCEYGFEEYQDYTAISQKRLTAQGNETSFMDADISVDMAKQICMIQRTPEGKKIREYFIALEKAWNTPEQIMARALKMANNTIDSLKTRNLALEEHNERMKPKEIFADAVAASDDLIAVGDLAKIIKQDGKPMGQKRLFKWMRDNKYLMMSGGQNVPTQRSMEMKLFRITERVIDIPNKSPLTRITVRVTGKGQQYFINKLHEEEQQLEFEW